MTDEKNHSSKPRGCNESELDSKELSLKEEVTRWRIPNRQPKDGDYFSREDLAKLQREKQASSDNEFRYHSIREDLIRQRKESQTDKTGKQKQTSSFLEGLLNPSFEEHYDLEQLNPIKSYDQFTHSEDEEDTSDNKMDDDVITDEKETEETYYVREIEPFNHVLEQDDRDQSHEDSSSFQLNDHPKDHVKYMDNEAITDDELFEEKEKTKAPELSSQESDQFSEDEGENDKENGSDIEPAIVQKEEENHTDLQELSKNDVGHSFKAKENDMDDEMKDDSSETEMKDDETNDSHNDQDKLHSQNVSDHTTEEEINDGHLFFGNADQQASSEGRDEDDGSANEIKESRASTQNDSMNDSYMKDDVDFSNDFKKIIKNQWDSYQEKGKVFREKFNPKSTFINTLKNVRYKIQKDDNDDVENNQSIQENSDASQTNNEFYVRWIEDDNEKNDQHSKKADDNQQDFEEGATQVFSTSEIQSQFHEKDTKKPQQISREWLRKHREHQIKNYPKGSLIDHMTGDTSFIGSNQGQQGPIIRDAGLDEMVAFDNMPVQGAKDFSSPSPSMDDNDTNFLSGAVWITFGMVFSRIIGALYVIPWATWFGDQWTKANGLFGAGYDPYVFFLALATAGIPSAIAKQISYNHSLGKYKTANILFKYSVYIMIASGLLFGVALYFMAPFLASHTAIVDKKSATLVIQSLAPALIILPGMSIIRGYFQGHSMMKPIAISDVIEQLVRVMYLLTATYAIMQVMNGEVTQAVIHSTFAAFVGAVASLIYLLIKFFKHRHVSYELIKQDAEQPHIDFVSSAKMIIKDSIPFIILGSGIIIAKLINTYTFGHILKQTSIFMLSEIEEMYGVLNLDVDKLIMIIVSLAIALSSSFLPALTRVYARKDDVGTSTMIKQIIIVFFFVMLPSSFGMAAISRNVYLLFYPNGSVLGPELLFTAAFSSIVLGLFTVLSSILQSMSFRLASVKFLIAGLLFKLILQYPFVTMFQAHGAIITTSLGLGLTCVFMWIKINREVEMDNYGIVNDLIRIIIPTILMGISAMMWSKVFNGLFPQVGRLGHLGIILLVILLSVIVYGGLMGLQGMLSIIIGDRFSTLQNKLRFKR